MRKRLIGGLVGSMLGLLAGILIQADLGMSATAQRIAFTCAGLVLGVMFTLLNDVFSGNTGFSSEE